MQQLEPVISPSHTSLRYITDTRSGITRISEGDGFLYINYLGVPVEDTAVLERIKRLAIPPAWQNVWICPFEYGHLQVTGFDSKGRKQYIYHPEWIQLNQQHKFNRMPRFGELLSKIRFNVNRDMQQRGLERNKVVATIVWLLEHTFVRIGNEEYAKDNNSYGLTTLRRKHTTITKDSVTFAFKGKSGVYHTVDIHDPLVTKIIKKCSEVPGYELFQYIDGGRRRSVDSTDVNEYLQTITGEDVTAKDFRTWGGTVLATKTLQKIGPYETEKQAKKNMQIAVKTVSQHLRNTPSVCRSYYIHPTVFHSYEENILLDFLTEHLALSQGRPRGLTQEEFAVLQLLRREPATDISEQM